MKAPLLLIALLFCACERQSINPHAGPPPPTIYASPTKKIIFKEAAVEQRMGFDFFANEPLRQKTVTIYYLVAEDGTAVEVGIGTYAKTKIGDQFHSNNWKDKE